MLPSSLAPGCTGQLGLCCGPVGEIVNERCFRAGAAALLNVSQDDDGNDGRMVDGGGARWFTRGPMIGARGEDQGW